MYHVIWKDKQGNYHTSRQMWQSHDEAWEHCKTLDPKSQPRIAQVVSFVCPATGERRQPGTASITIN